jgi:DNA-binding Xre family transcriptional regulator
VETYYNSKDFINVDCKSWFQLKNKYNLVGESPILAEATMDEAMLKKILHRQNLTLEELSDRSKLSVEKIQAINTRSEELFSDVQKIASALDMPISDLLEEIVITSVKGNKKRGQEPRNPGTFICELFPNLPQCKNNS